LLEEFGVIANIAILILSLVILIKASSWAITNTVKLAAITGLGKTKIGFILVAFSTSLPELFVAAFSALNPETIGISIGNVLGSNIANISLILGLGFLIMAFKYPASMGFFTRMAKEEVGSLNFGIFVTSIVPLILLYFNFANQIVGASLIILFFYNMYTLLRKRETVEQISDTATKKELGTYFFKSFLGIIGVVASAYFIVNSASFLAISAGVPAVIVGATVIAFGTSVPELATSIDSIRKGYLDLAVGNVIGSCFINITLVLGLTLLLAPFNVSTAVFSDLILFSLITNIILWYMLQNTKITKRDGVILLAMYVVFLVITFSGS